MSEAAMAQYQAAEDLAEQRGCVPENYCWDACVRAALEELYP